MRRRTRWLAVLATLFWAVPPLHAQTPGSERIELRLDTGEADQVLAILALRAAGKPVADEEWQQLFATVPYRRLKQREQAMAERFHDPSRVLTDEAFKQFVLSDTLLARAPELRQTLERWRHIDLHAAARGVLAYLPAEAVIRATVYPMIKPRGNSFVWDTRTDPAIFLYLDPGVSGAKFANTVSHELHHIGISSLGPVYDSATAGLPAPARAAAQWMGAFGEGLAMLAAAGGPDVDPHAASSAQEHARWVHDLGDFDADLPRVNQFLLDVLSARLPQDSLEVRGSAFYGIQGPWYTVGYRMAVLVERRFGRPALIRTMTDYRCLLALYNRAAMAENREHAQQLPLWSDALLTGVRASTCGVAAAGP